MSLTNNDIRVALSAVIDPELRAPITDLGMVDRIEVSDSRVDVRVLLTIVGCPAANAIERDVRAALGQASGDLEIDLEMGVMNPEQRGALISKLRSGKKPTNPFTPE